MVYMHKETVQKIKTITERGKKALLLVSLKGGQRHKQQRSSLKWEKSYHKHAWSVE